MKSNQVYSSPGTAGSPIGADGIVPGSFAHLRHASLYGQDRRSLLNYYRDDPFTKPVLPPLDDTGHGAARDEVHGSVDKHIISEDWAEALRELGEHSQYAAVPCPTPCFLSQLVGAVWTCFDMVTELAKYLTY